MKQEMSVEKTKFDGLLVIHPYHVDDLRGSFTKDYSSKMFKNLGIEYELKEIFYSTSIKGVLRGLHFQNNIPQPKLIRCISGHIYDVVVDLRPTSKTYLHWESFDLYGDGLKEILIPAGFAHGFLALETSTMCYKCAEWFSPNNDDGIAWNDPQIGINWPLEKIGGENKLIQSEKDKKLKKWSELMKKPQI